MCTLLPVLFGVPRDSIDDFSMFASAAVPFLALLSAASDYNVGSKTAQEVAVFHLEISR